MVKIKLYQVRKITSKQYKNKKLRRYGKWMNIYAHSQCEAISKFVKNLEKQK